MHNLSLIMRKHQTTLNKDHSIKKIYKFFKNVDVIKDKERLKEFSKSNDSKGTRQLNTIPNLRLDSVLKEKNVIKDILGASDKFGIQMIGQLEYCINVKFTKVGNWTVAM